MEEAQVKKTWKEVKFHARIAWRGFCRTIYGALVAGLIALAIFGFVSVTTETGWSAVFDFVGSCIILAVALSNMYLIGCRKSKGTKRG